MVRVKDEISCTLRPAVRDRNVNLRTFRDADPIWRPSPVRPRFLISAANTNVMIVIENWH